MLIETGVVNGERNRARISEQHESGGPRENPAVAQVSHELRNCLSAIGGAMRVLDIEAVAPDARRQARMIVDRQLRQMARLVDDLVDAALVRAGRLRVERERIDLRTPLTAALAAVEFDIRRRGQRLRVEIPPVPLWLHADSGRLEQVFTNLLVNAAKYTHPGGEIRVAAESLESEVAVRVGDNGIGISPELLAQLFEPYVRARSHRQGSIVGLGLGLSLVRDLVESHGGRIEAASEGIGRGSVFSVWLPLAASH